MKGDCDNIYGMNLVLDMFNGKSTSVLVTGVARYKTTTTTADYIPTTYRLRADYLAQVGKLLASVSCSASRDGKKQASEAKKLPGCHQRYDRHLFTQHCVRGSEACLLGRLQSS